MLPVHQTRLVVLFAKLALCVALVLVGLLCFVEGDVYSRIYWLGLTAIGISILAAKAGKLIARRMRFHARLRAVIPAHGADLSRLTAIASAIKEGHEERAFFLFENLALKSPEPETVNAARWLRALAGARWMARQKPTRAISGFYERYPQLHLLMFCHGVTRAPIRRIILVQELVAANSKDLDSLAQNYISLIDMLVHALNDANAPFSGEAEELLEFLTGKAYVVGSGERFLTWWRTMRPVLVRGGGALLVGVRLMEHEAYAEAAELLNRLALDGMLSTEADTIRRAASFLSLFVRPQWRMTSSDLPRYFTEGHYYLATDMGVLRFPTAELPEVVACCRQGKVLRDSKKRLIEDALDLWDIFGDEMAAQLTTLMKRLLQHKGRHSPGRASFWREQWEERKGGFERPIALLMDGITATAAKDYARARKLFEEAARLEPQSSLPLVNLLHLKLLQNKPDEARAMVNDILKIFPRDGQAMISMGRLLAMHLEDTKEAERLFIKAMECTDPPVEALTCLGEVKLLEGAYLESQHYFDHARQLDPNLPDAKLGLARVYMEIRRFELAIENLESVISEGQGEAATLAHYLMYRTYREMGNDRKAFEHLDQVPTPFFKEPDVLDDIAVHLESDKKYNKAREFAERAMILRAGGGGSNDDPQALNTH